MTELSHGNEPQQAALIQDEILEILKEAKVLARRFYRLTGKPLGCLILSSTHLQCTKRLVPR